MMITRWSHDDHMMITWWIFTDRSWNFTGLFTLFAPDLAAWVRLWVRWAQLSRKHPSAAAGTGTLARPQLTLEAWVTSSEGRSSSSSFLSSLSARINKPMDSCFEKTISSIWINMNFIAYLVPRCLWRLPSLHPRWGREERVPADGR